MGNITNKQFPTHQEFYAQDGFVLTNYKEGDPQIVYSKKVISQLGTELVGFYAMPEKEAQKIAKELRPKREEPKKDNDESVSED